MKTIQTENAPAAVGPYSQAVRTGDLLFCSGQVPIDPKTGEMIRSSITDQTHQVMKNLSAVLEAADLGLGNLVKVSIFLKNMDDFASVNEVYASYLEKPYPARATVQVSRLPLDADVEIEAIAEF